MRGHFALQARVLQVLHGSQNDTEIGQGWLPGSGVHHSRSACTSACSHSLSAGAASPPWRSSGERSTSCPAERGCGFRFQAADFQLGVSTGESSTNRTLVRFLGTAAPAPPCRQLHHGDVCKHWQLERLLSAAFEPETRVTQDL